MNILKKVTLLGLCLMGFAKSYAQTEVIWYTSMGNWEVELTDNLTPITVDSFLARVEDKFYDGTIFHRVIDNFMIQGGDPLGTGYGGTGYPFQDEFVASLKNVPGALAMANSGPNTNESQFFINLVTNTHLNNHHTVFGMVTTGFSIVQDIGNVPTDANDKPITDVVLDSIRVKIPSSVPGVPGKAIARIYPNPSQGLFNIDLTSDNTEVQITNLQGQVVYKASGKEHLPVDLRYQPRGLYMIRASNENGTSATKLILQ